MRVGDELRAAWRSLAEAEADQPGYAYDCGYLTGWHDERRHIRHIRPAGPFRDSDAIAEFRLGYRHGREDGKGRDHDWWPDHAHGPLAVRALRSETGESPTTGAEAVSGATQPVFGL